MSDKEKYFRAYFGGQADYYLENYMAYRTGNRYVFNFWAFFIGIWWFLYRKLWKEATVIVLIFIFLGMTDQVISKIFNIEPDNMWILRSLLGIILSICLGFLGNYLYLKDAEKKVNSVLNDLSNDDDRILALQRMGGVSPAPFILLLLITCAMIVLISIRI